MMRQPLGGTKSNNSPHFHQVVLSNWARRTGYEIGREGWVGRSLFVTIRLSLGFCIETRGVHAAETRMHFPFERHDRRQRREQFARARICFEGGYILGSYAGKIAIWDRLPPLRYPSFGECLRRHISGGKPFGEDERELAASQVWQAWLHLQQVGRFRQGGAA